MNPCKKLPSRRHRTATFYLDESGSKSSAGKFFVVGLAKTYLPGRLSWELRHVRERYNFKSEFKFTKVKKDTLPAYCAMIDAAVSTRTLLAAFVLDSRNSDQFGDRPTWKAQADLATQLVLGNFRVGDLGTLVMDVITTPCGFSLAEAVKRKVNDKLGGLGIVGAMDFDSQASMELQLADIISGAVNYERKAKAHMTAAQLDSDSPKSQLVRFIQKKYQVDSFDDRSTYLMNIRTAKH
ncbi:MAG: DUF3800 domain-containing protein [Actinomycetaceae bacterium]|nr:DUF3800 domain-containing protein [Actinomycetaceae bacterium]MDY6082548.1 DUF3800 domain-containing protein [Actinomycetaceae bacterium]